LWDGKVIGVQVSDAREQTMEVRIIAPPIREKPGTCAASCAKSSSPSSSRNIRTPCLASAGKTS
jgi:hypothetical protein